MSTPQQILKKYWNHDAFRPLQEDIIQAVLEGKDVLALLPTGGGKSVCFQVPALAKDGLCLVISPLIALMKDQVENLKKRNIPALSIYSGMSHREVKETLQNAAYGEFKFLYVSPERLETRLFKEFQQALPLNLIAVDEAHCISQWGYDFRPPYLRIAAIKEYFPVVPVLALTASATPIVQDDICEKLQFKQPNIFRQSFEKPNLSFSALQADSKVNKLLDILQKVPGTAIVYCRNRKRTKEFAHLLALNNISADYYHAGLPKDDRNRRQEAWINNETRVIVCTNAFGMGIDKPDVRTVVHIDIPDNLENYYQEAGRAGRDGKQSFAVLLYVQKELAELQQLPQQKYPSVKKIREIYQALANYLQLAIGSGEGMYFDFNLATFIRQFQLELIPAVNALKALEQDGHLTFNEQVFLLAKAGFCCNKETLEQFQASHPELENVSKYLLRTYEGIFDNMVSINEKLLSHLTKLTADELQAQLNKLQAFNIITYQPQKETPQIYFSQNRAPAEHLTFNHEQYNKRREQYALRVEAMYNFVTLQNACRSQFIGYYFGDAAMKKCGQCDNCIRQKKLLLSQDEFEAIAQQVFLQVPDTGTELVHLFAKLTGTNKDKLWKVLDHLQAEKRLSVDTSGNVYKV